MQRAARARGSPAARLTSPTARAAQVDRLERSRRFVLHSSRPLTDAEKASFAALVHDRMTEELYKQPVRSFKDGLQVRGPRAASSRQTLHGRRLGRTGPT
jgi:hypothetical protein